MANVKIVALARAWVLELAELRSDIGMWVCVLPGLYLLFSRFPSFSFHPVCPLHYILIYHIYPKHKWWYANCKPIASFKIEDGDITKADLKFKAATSENVGIKQASKQTTKQIHLSKLEDVIKCDITRMGYWMILGYYHPAFIAGSQCYPNPRKVFRLRKKTSNFRHHISSL